MAVAFSVFVPGTSYRAARRRCPRAAIICRVEGGFHCFASRRDHKIWEKPTMTRDTERGDPDRRYKPGATPLDALEGMQVMRLAGRGRPGLRDEGWTYHALVNGRPLCGKRPGRTSAGWIAGDPLVRGVTCRLCCKSLLKQSQTP